MKKTIHRIIGHGGVEAYHHIKGHVAAAIHGYPANDMRVIGITGTNGKTTTANLVAAIFEKAGYRVALSTTIRHRILGNETVNKMKMTVPGAFSLNKFIKTAQKAGCNILVLEVTSIALSQMRVAGILFDTVALTNITHDHLDYHGTFENYVSAKRKLFENNPRVSVLNVDDKSGREFASLKSHEQYYYSLDEKNEAAIRPSAVEYHEGYTKYRLVIPQDGYLEIKTHLPGDFNVQNIMAAVGIGLGFKIKPDVIKTGIESVRAVAGRMERVEAGQPFSVIVDYAHTPDALEKMYAAINPSLNGGNIISVLGSCGDRDKTKRPVLGAIAGKNAKYVMVTNEDPYTEDPKSIIDAVAEGVNIENKKQKEGETYWRIFDRREAITKAIGLAKPGDVVTITGKGAEEAMVWGNEHRPWSDVKVAREEIEKLLGKK